jgi:ribosomal protein S18 acetylase RimI-like enzyme
MAIVKSATGAEKNALLSTLTLAFGSDPMIRWMLPNPHVYIANFPEFAHAFGGAAFEHGSAYCTEGYLGACLWLPPTIEPDFEKLIGMMYPLAPDGIKEDMVKVAEISEGFHPDEPHWYLPLIGVDPIGQGKGQGSILMKHALERCDNENKIAYLESSNPRNISLYERFGFKVTGEIQSGSSPTIWPMLRKPQPDKE